MSANRPTAPGKTLLQVGAQLVGHRDAVADQVLAGPAGAAQRDGGRAVGDQRAQPGPVGAQGVGQHERVEPVVLVAGRAVAAAQVLDLVRADHHHGDPGLEQGVDDRAVGRSIADLADSRRRPARPPVAQAGGGVLDRAPGDLAAAGVHDRHGVIVAGPVDAAGHAVRAVRAVGQGSAGRLHVSLLAARPSGEAPSCGAGTRLPVRSLIGARWRSALSTVGTSRVTAGPRRTHAGRQDASSEQGGDPAAPRVHQRPIQDHRHKDGAPVSDRLGDNDAEVPQWVRDLGITDRLTGQERARRPGMP